MYNIKIKLIPNYTKYLDVGGPALSIGPSTNVLNVPCRIVLDTIGTFLF